MTLATTMDWVRAAAPPDPTEAQLREAEERVLARVRLRSSARVPPCDGSGTRVGEAAAGQRGDAAGGIGGSGWRVGRRAIACVLLLGIPLLGGVRSGSSSLEGGTGLAQEGVAALDPWGVRVAQAAAGDGLARQRLEQGGRAARAAVLTFVEHGGGGARELEWLSDSRAIWGSQDLERLARLAGRPELNASALGLLVRDPTPGGVRVLSEMLLAALRSEEASAARSAGPVQGAEAPPAAPPAHAPIVAALDELARRGRPEAALQPLLMGLAQGCTLCGETALAWVGAAGLERWLDSVPPPALNEPRLLAALRRAPATTQSRMLRLAERGHAGARRMGSQAALPAWIPWLSEQLYGPLPAEVERAARGLKAIGGPLAVLALARALQAAHGERVAHVVRELDAGEVRAVVAHARGSWRDTTAALRVLAEHPGEHGETWRRLAGESRWGAQVISALAECGDVRASVWLADIALDQGPVAVQAVAALGERLRAGDALARQQLRRLEDGPLARVVRAFLDAGSSADSEGRQVPGGAPGRAWVRRGGPTTTLGST